MTNEAARKKLSLLLGVQAIRNTDTSVAITMAIHALDDMTKCKGCKVWEEGQASVICKTCSRSYADKWHDGSMKVTYVPTFLGHKTCGDCVHLQEVEGMIQCNNLNVEHTGKGIFRKPYSKACKYGYKEKQ